MEQRMKKTTVYFNDRELVEIDKRAAVTGLKRNQYIRYIVTRYFRMNVED